MYTYLFVDATAVKCMMHLACEVNKDVTISPVCLWGHRSKESDLLDVIPLKTYHKNLCYSTTFSLLKNNLDYEALLLLMYMRKQPGNKLPFSTHKQIQWGQPTFLIQDVIDLHVNKQKTDFMVCTVRTVQGCISISIPYIFYKVTADINCEMHLSATKCFFIMVHDARIIWSTRSASATKLFACFSNVLL